MEYGHLQTSVGLVPTGGLEWRSVDEVNSAGLHGVDELRPDEGDVLCSQLGYEDPYDPTKRVGLLEAMLNAKADKGSLEFLVGEFGFPVFESPVLHLDHGRLRSVQQWRLWAIFAELQSAAELWRIASVADQDRLAALLDSDQSTIWVTDPVPGGARRKTGVQRYEPTLRTAMALGGRALHDLWALRLAAEQIVAANLNKHVVGGLWRPRPVDGTAAGGQPLQAPQVHLVARNPIGAAYLMLARTFGAPYGLSRCVECGSFFLASRADHRFCHQSHRDRWHKRDKRRRRRAKTTAK